MGLLDDLSSLWNAVSQTASSVIQSLEDGVARLGSLGVPSFPSLPQFIQFLVEMGENPFLFLPNLVSHILGKGGSPIQVLEELAEGFLNEGPQTYTQRQVTKVITPLIATVQKHTQTASALGTLHQGTITQVKQKLSTLRQGTSTSPGLQGDFALAVDSHFATIESAMGMLTGPFGIQLQDPWPVFQSNFISINQAFVDALSVVPKMATAFALFDLAVISVEVVCDTVITVGTLGIGDVLAIPAEVAIDLVLVVGELAIIGVWIVGDAVFWAVAVLGALAALGIEEIIYQATRLATAQATATSGTTVAQYSNPALNPDEKKLLQDIKKWLSDHNITLPDNADAWLKYLIGLLGTTGVSIAAIRAMVLCLIQKGYLGEAYTKVWNTITQQLEPDDLQGAWKDVCGMKVTKGGRTWTHFQKVTDGYKSLQNFLSENPGAPPPLKAAIQATLNYVNEVIDRSCNRKDSEWKDQARGPFWQILLQQSGCINAGAGK